MATDERTVSMKAYLLLPNEKYEIRRFGIPETLATDFLSLKDRITAVFSLQKKFFEVSWPGKL